MIEGQPGTLYYDLLATELMLDIRWLPGVDLSPALDRFHPVAGIRGGASLLAYRNPLLLDESDLIIVAPEGDVTVVPTAGADLGVELRLDRRWIVGALLSASVATNGYRQVGIRVEASWMTY